VPLKRRGAARRARGHGDLLVPADGSAASRAATRQAVALARRLGAGIVAVHVITPFELTLHGRSRAAIVTVDEFRRRAERTARRILDEVARAAAGGGVRCRCEPLWDTAVAEAIVRAARRHRCALIVMSSRGRGALQRILLGSVSRRVLALARVPVVMCA